LKTAAPSFSSRPWAAAPATEGAGELGKIGSNINQIAYHLNAGRPGDVMKGGIESALRELFEMAHRADAGPGIRAQPQAPEVAPHLIDSRRLTSYS